MKKLLLFFLVSVMMILPLAACTNQTENTEESNTVDANTEETYYLNTLSKDGYDFEDIRIATIETNMAVEEIVVDTTVLEQKKYERNALLEEHFDIEISYITVTDDSKKEVEELTVLAMAQSDSNPDCFIKETNTLMSLAINGLNTNLLSVNSLGLENEWWCQSMNENLMFNNSLYVTAGPVSEFYYNAPVALAFNKSMATDFGLPDLYDLVLAGNWTLEELKKCCTDYGVYAMDETTQRYAISSTVYVAPYSSYVSAGGKFATIQDNQIIVNIADANSIDIIEKCLQAFDPEKTYGAGVNDAIKMFTDAKSLFLYTTVGYMELPLPGSEIDYGIIPCPKYDSTQKDYVSCAWPVSNYSLSIPAYMEGDRLAWTGLFLDAYCFLGQDMIKPVKYDTLLKYQVAQDPESSKIMDMIYNNMYFDINLAADLGGSRSLVSNALVNGMGRYTAAYQAIIGNVNNDIAKYGSLTQTNS